MNENRPQEFSSIPTEGPPQNSQHKRPLLWIVIIVVIGLLALGSFFFWQWLLPSIDSIDLEQETIQQSSPSDSTASRIPTYDESLYEGWGTYADEESGYSLRVPSGWISKQFIEPHSDDYFRVAFGAPNGVLSYIGEEEAYKVYMGCNVVSITAIPSKFSVEGVISQIMDTRSELDNATRTEVQVGSLSAVQFDESIFPFDSRDRNPRHDGFTTFVKHNEAVFMFAGVSCETEKEQFKKLHGMMLASIEFSGIAQQGAEEGVTIDTSAWEVYTNENFGYSLKIPPDFRERWTGLDDESKSFEVYSNPDDLSKPQSERWVRADLDIRLFEYENSALRGTKEENLAFFDTLKNATDNEELMLDGEVVLKVRNANLDSREAPQFLVGGLTYATVYAGENYLISFDFEANEQSDFDKYIPLVDAAISTFQFNDFNP